MGDVGRGMGFEGGEQAGGCSGVLDSWDSWDSGQDQSCESDESDAFLLVSLHEPEARS